MTVQVTYLWNLSWSSKVSCQAEETMPRIYVSYRFVGQPSYRIILQETIQQQFPADAARTSLFLCRIFTEEDNILIYYLTQIIFPFFWVKCKSFVCVYALFKEATLKSRVSRQKSITISVPGNCCPWHTGAVSP